MLKSSSTAERLPAQLASGCPSTLTAAQAYRGGSAQTQRSLSLVRWLFPSLADMIFMVLLWMLVFAPLGAGLLHDADTGWHIRNGQHIARTLSIPRTDDFSYTMNDKPWFAWEWLYDAGVGLLAARLGLNGVVLFTAAVIGFTLALLFRSLVMASGNLLVSALLAVLAALSAQVHMLARPHVVGWLLTLLWVRLLYRFQAGRSSALWWLPGLLLVWVNVHGSFVLGLVLLVLFAVGNFWTYLTTVDATQKQESRTTLSRLGITAVFCALATLATPYGYKLHLHVYHYLSNRYFMDHISEFAAPKFHGGAEKYFVALVVLAFLAAVLAARRLRAVDVILILFATYTGLYAIRNIPVSSMLIAMATAPALSEAIRSAGQRSDLPDWLRQACAGMQERGARMKNVEEGMRGHLLPAVMLVASLAVAVNGGRLFKTPVLAAHFDQRKFPVAAAEFVAAQDIHDHMFSTDRWSGYLIYRLYPQTRLFIDDRHDLYGEAFLKNYLKVLGADFGWREVLDKHRITSVLIPPDAPLANVLKETPDWKVAYDDGVAILFARATPLLVPASTANDPQR
jgi:hypothetical protein